MKSRNRKSESHSRKSKSGQQRFSGEAFKQEFRFGANKRTTARDRKQRPLSSKDPIHLLLRSTKAKGRFSFGHSENLKKVNDLVREHCERYGVKLIEYSNNYNHLHLLVKFGSRALYLRFIRSLTGALAIAVSGASKLKRLKDIFGSKGFWDFRPFTRVVKSWRGYKVARDYVTLNNLEAAGVLPKRDGRLRDVEPGERHWFKSRSP